MRILFVGLQYIHTSRWINQLKDSRHEIYLFDCLDKPIHEDLKWTNYITNWSKRKVRYIKGEHFFNKKFPRIYKIIEPNLQITSSEKLIEIIKNIKPDIVHSLEMQAETYPILKAYKKLKFKWVYSCWGNDIFYFSKIKKHKNKINNCVKNIDYFFLECERDKKLIRSISDRGIILGTSFPGGGGYDLQLYEKFYRNNSQRKLILIKGYEHLFGRALNILNALELIINDIKDFDIYVYSAHDKVIEKIIQMNKKYNLNIEYSSRYKQIKHIELLKKFGEAKISIGNNISDGVPNTLLEGLISGAFPIQSNPGGASEDFIKDGKNGFLINDPNNIINIADLISKALSNRDLVKSAAIENKIISKRLDYLMIKGKVLEAYNKIEIEL